MPAPPTRLFDVAADVLAAVVTYHGAPLPARQFVSAGPPAWDCDLLAVWVETIEANEGNPAQAVQQPLATHAGHTMRHATVVVELVRCHPMADDQGDQVIIPSTDEEQGSAQALYGDYVRVDNAVRSAEKAGELGGCSDVAFVGWQVVGPDGGLVGGRQRYRVSLSTLST